MTTQGKTEQALNPTETWPIFIAYRDDDGQEHARWLFRHLNGRPVHAASSDESAPPGSSGRANEDFDVRIFDDNDNELPPNTPGEIVIRPRRPHIMFEGYWNRPADTLKIMRNMWLHSGDIGKFDENGYFYFVDRMKDYLRRRGENISSFEVETGLRAHPDIADVAVHAVFSESGEDDVKATIVLKDGAGITEEDICVWAIDRLPYFTIPRYFEFRSDLRPSF